MKKFIKTILLFILPVIIGFASLETLLRGIPNDYLRKKEFLDGNSNRINCLILGSSHAFYGINPADSSLNGFNASYISQSLDYDFEILKMYSNNWSNLEYIVIPISYASLYYRLAGGDESWRVKNYNIYYGMKTSRKFVDYMETLSNKLKVNLDRLYSYYICGIPNVTCSDLGWGVKCNSKNRKNLDKTGEIAAKRHTGKDRKYFKENMDVVRAMIEFARGRNVKVLLCTLPAYRSYVEHLDGSQMAQTVCAMDELAQAYKNCRYVNLLEDKSFTEADFYDADHLNEIGARKLTLKLDGIIKEMN